MLPNKPSPQLDHIASLLSHTQCTTNTQHILESWWMIACSSPSTLYVYIPAIYMRKYPQPMDCLLAPEWPGAVWHTTTNSADFSSLVVLLMFVKDTPGG
jgi:hypothetical protein